MKRIIFGQIFLLSLAIVSLAQVDLAGDEQREREEGEVEGNNYEAVSDRVKSWEASVATTKRDLDNWEAEHASPPKLKQLPKWRATFGKDFGIVNNNTRRPFRILFVSELEVYVTSMSRWYFHTHVSKFAVVVVVSPSSYRVAQTQKFSFRRQ